MNLFRLKMIFVFTLLTVLNLAQAEFRVQHYYVDLRDHMQSGTYNDLPTHTIQVAIESRICEFVAPIDPNTQKPNIQFCDLNKKFITNPNMKFTRDGAVGPTGYVNDETFYPQDRKEWSRSDVIFSVEFDGPNSVHKLAEGVYQADIILFIHDSNQSSPDVDQYYFRKMTVVTDASQNPIDNPNRVQIIKVSKDIPLSQTHFEVYADITERKLVLVDKYNQITKVFPIGVGSLDVRTLPGMDGFIGSMTEELKTNAIVTKTNPINDQGQPIGQIYQERNDPEWYRGRPFIGILDENGTKYKEIGFHYQIDSDKLKRGFVSHGCIRVRDKDLYQLEVVVFKGLQENIPVKVVNSFYQDQDLTPFTQLDHPYPKINSSFKRILYADKNYVSPENRASVDPSIIGIAKSTSFTEVERFEWCRQNGKYNVLRYNGPWASILGTDCLTRTATESRSVAPFINYMLGYTNEIPSIAPHQTSNISQVAPNLNSSLICFGSLSDASQIYPNISGGIALTYKDYVNTCGCEKLRQELRRGKYRKGKEALQAYCR